LSQHTVNLNVEDSYQKLKALLNEKGCKVISEAPPKQLSVQQGSLWGVSPKTAKKTINITLEPAEEKTTIKYSSKLSSDWKNITIIGCILAFALAVVCVWMALDLGAFLVGGNPSFWSWLVTAEGQVEFQAGEAFVNLAWGLAIFLFVVIAVEAVVFVYARSKIEAFAAEVVGELA
jgi:hypothetical protein